MTRSPITPTDTHSSRGFSLVEFMVAMVLGLIIIGGAISVYLASKNSLTEVEQVAAVSENGRFALQVLNYATKNVGFFGGAKAWYRVPSTMPTPKTPTRPGME